MLLVGLLLVAVCAIWDLLAWTGGDNNRLLLNGPNFCPSSDCKVFGRARGFFGVVFCGFNQRSAMNKTSLLIVILFVPC